MNFLEKILWRWQGKRKLRSDRIALQYTAIRKLGEIGNSADVELLLPYLDDKSQLVRNAAAHAIREIIHQTEDQANMDEISTEIIEQFHNAKSLTHRLSVIETMRALPLQTREEVLATMIIESQNDLQYAVIQSLVNTSDIDILDDVLHASDTVDLVIRRMALQTWYHGIAGQKLEVVLGYITPRLHYLIRAAYELQTDGEFLRQALAHADRRELPHPKAYPDFMIRYITELLGNWEYDPDAYRSLHAIMVPSYFTFEQGKADERPYIIL